MHYIIRIYDYTGAPYRNEARARMYMGDANRKEARARMYTGDAHVGLNLTSPHVYGRQKEARARMYKGYAHEGLNLTMLNIRPSQYCAIAVLHIYM